MTPDEVLRKLREMGVNTSRSTLLRFEKDGLIPMPKRGSGGRAQGRFSEYPENTPIFFFSAWMLVKSKKFTKNEIIYGIMIAKIEIDSILNSLENEKNDNDLESKEIEKKYKLLWNFFEYDNNDFRIRFSVKYMKENLVDLFPEEKDGKTYVPLVVAGEWKDFIISSTKDTRSLIESIAIYEEESFYFRRENLKLEEEIIKLQQENKQLKKILKKHGISPA